MSDPIGLAPEQAVASNPGRSAWISANAGSGKTRVLTSRVARLLLAGTQPDRILCLTFTRAAAGEMKERLFQTLGGWAMRDEAGLAEELNGLLEADEPRFDPGDRTRLNRARRLFAQALEFPGGLRIQTIHAFSLTLLQRFPMEAGLAPGITLLDERVVDDLSEEAFEATIRKAKTSNDDLGDAYRVLTRDASERTLQEIREAILASGRLYRERIREIGAEALAGAVYAKLGTVPGSPDETVRNMLASMPASTLECFEKVLLACQHHHTSTAKGKYAPALAEGLRQLREGSPLLAVENLRVVFFTVKGDRRARPYLLVEPRGREAGEHQIFDTPDIYWECTEYLEKLEERRRAAAVANLSVAVIRLAGAYLDAYESAKRREAGLDYNDVVERAAGLLTEGAARDWIRYRLDGGVDHILVDESQDTSPAQWRTICRVAEEFFSGAAMAGATRSVFAVGDEKQSIFSFQGADLRSFRESRDWFDAEISAGGGALTKKRLDTSYRSSPAILGFVDETFRRESFDMPEGVGDKDFTEVTEPPEEWANTLLGWDAPLQHRAHRADAAGRVEVWDLVGVDHEPQFKVAARKSKKALAELELARRIVDRIEHWLKHGTPLPGSERPIEAGDIMILVQRRGVLAHEILRLLCERNIPATGTHRMVLREHIAVMDALALARTALLPEDDATLAAVLRSPFCNIDEEGLFELAWDRDRESLWSRLREGTDREPERFGPAWRFLDTMRETAARTGPFEFFERALTELGGRRRVLARLGNDANEPLDELVSRALDFELREHGTLEEFVHMIERDRRPMKSSAAAAGTAIRVLTIHGAKGLESPIVFVPEADRLPDFSHRQRLLEAADAEGNPIPLFVRTTDDDVPTTVQLRQEHARREREESYRLFYVALTRARDWLIVAGVRGGRAADFRCWHARALCAAERTGARIAEDGDVIGRIGTFQPGWIHESGDTGAAGTGETPSARQSTTLPDWATQVPPAEPPSPVWLAPSRIGEGLAPTKSEVAVDVEEAANAGETAISAPMDYGTLVHALLERLPGVTSPEERDAFATEIAAQFGGSLSQDQCANAVRSAERVLNDADLAWIFAPGGLSEADFFARGEGPLAGVTGKIDRLVFDDDRIVIVDFKSDSAPASDPKSTSVRYLAQLGAYRDAVSRIYPDRQVEAGILWTAADPPRFVLVPDAMADEAFRDACGYATGGESRQRSRQSDG